MVTGKKFADLDPHTVTAGTVVWCKGTTVTQLATFLEVLEARKLEMYYVGPGDRYVVRCEKPAAHISDPNPCVDTSLLNR